MATTGRTADICLFVEGSYPYVRGGVSSWVHDLIQSQDHLTFHVVSIMPEEVDVDPVYDLPSNVISHKKVVIQRIGGNPTSRATLDAGTRADIKERIKAITSTGTLDDLRALSEVLEPYKNQLGRYVLLDSEDAMQMLTEIYEETMPEASFLDYFWSMRGLLGSLFSVMLRDIPSARVYHTTCTGYAGLMAARAHLETGRPAVLTEHGIYTNERRIEIASVDWLERDAMSRNLTIDRTRRELRDLWMDSFTNFSRICYQAASKIITLYEGNQGPQIADGADPSKMALIPNGIDVERFAEVERLDKVSPHTIAFIGRVVPIKDVKNFIRVCAELRKSLPDLKAYIMGPTDEDPDYYEECVSMVEHFALQDTITFTGNVTIDDYLPEIDVLVLTSISEAQPLVILEAGAAGIPTVATNVGACEELIMGRDDGFGAGGAIVLLSNPRLTSQAVYELLTDQSKHRASADAMKKRVNAQYNKQLQYEAYRDLYTQLGGDELSNAA